MSSMDGVVAALEAALAGNPGDVGVRLHLANVLSDGGKPQAALEHFAAVLSEDPVNLAALAGAALAADRANIPARAAAYRKLHASLGGTPGAAAPAAVSAVPQPAAAVTDVPAPAAPPVAAGPRAGAPRLRVIQGGVEPDDDFDDVGDDAPLGASEDDRPPSITLADIGGMVEVKRRLDMAFLAPLRNPELRKMYAKKLKGGLLMYGPPGCGKTHIARALAGELKARFISVGLPDVLDMYIGESEKRLHEIFENARRKAPAVLFFDEIDALGQKRSLQRGASTTRNVVNQLLNEMDGTERDNEGVFILGATNHPWDVDSALRRPGRFDRAVLVLPPDAPARETILQLQLRDKPVDGIDIPALARQTPLFSGADLAYLCENATEHAMEDAVRTGKARAITMADFKRAVKDAHASTRPWFELAKNYAMFANEGGVYDDLLAFIKDNKL